MSNRKTKYPSVIVKMSQKINAICALQITILYWNWNNTCKYNTTFTWKSLKVDINCISWNTVFVKTLDIGLKQINRKLTRAKGECWRLDRCITFCEDWMKTLTCSSVFKTVAPPSCYAVFSYHYRQVITWQTSHICRYKNNGLYGYLSVYAIFFPNKNTSQSWLCKYLELQTTTINS